MGASTGNFTQRIFKRYAIKIISLVNFSNNFWDAPKIEFQYFQNLLIWALAGKENFKFALFTIWSNLIFSNEIEMKFEMSLSCSQNFIYKFKFQISKMCKILQM